jgi:uncharacterized membrane protein YeiH
MELTLGMGVEAVGVAVFALTGALVAARKGMDPFGFALLATVTGIGGGSVRDMLLGLPAFWTSNPADLVVCITVGVLTFLLGSRVPGLMAAVHPRRLLLWADALGLAIFSVTGAAKALAEGTPAITAIVMGTLTSSFGGIIRDILAGDVPLVLHREIYVTAGFLGAAIYVFARSFDMPAGLAGFAGILAAFVLRGLAVSRDWSLPAFRAKTD